MHAIMICESCQFEDCCSLFDLLINQRDGK